MQQQNKPVTARKSLAAVIGLIMAVQAFGSSSDNDDALQEVIVYGSRGALINALEKQRESNKVSSVVDSDAMGNFADINVSESLRRLPGIMVENDQGEGRYVSVRGMNADLNAMTINGVSTASPENRRGVMLDGVPTDLLESMTVYKTLTPDLDADTIGGAIDLETISAFKYDSFFARIKAESSYNELTKDGNNPNLALTVTNRFDMAGGELGAALTLSDQTRRIVAENSETGGWGEESIDSDWEMRHYDLERERQGIVLNLDFHANSGNKYYLRMFHNEYTDTEDRSKWEVRRAMEEDAQIDGDIYTYPFQRVDTESRPRVEVRTISSFQLGGEFQFSDRSTLRAEVFASEAEQDDTDKWNGIYRSRQLNNTPLTYDNSNPKKPVVNFAQELYDPANFAFNALESEVAVTKDQDIGFRFDLSYAMSNTTELKYGVKYRQREKENDFNFCGYEPVNDATLADHDHRFIGDYLGNVHGPSPTYGGVRALIPTLGSGSVALSDGTSCRAPGDLYELSGDEDVESIAADWYTDEDIGAGYLMATTITDFATYVYGLRYEKTKATYRGKLLDDEVFAGNVSYKNDYGFWAPSLNITFNLAEDQLLRLGIFRSLVRPGFGESSAGAEIDVEDNEIEGGNPDIDPTTAWNFDLSYEYYVNDETFIGGGLFYKDIEDAIVEVDAANVILRGQLWDHVQTYINTSGSSIWGGEVAFQTALQNGFVMALNYTYADGETDLPENSAYGVRTIPYFKQAKHTANLTLGYSKGPWDLRITGNYRDDFLDAIGNSALTDRYTSDFFQVDLNAKYRFNDHLTLRASAINLNDRPEYYYFGNKSRMSQYDEFGTTYEFGFTYTF
ncbi:MAG: TonB-dependent receptor [Porticoccaceae bacterium]